MDTSGPECLLCTGSAAVAIPRWTRTKGTTLTTTSLFLAYRLQITLEDLASQAVDAAQDIRADRVMHMPVDDLVDELFEEFHLDPLSLDPSKKRSSGAKDIKDTAPGRRGRSSTTPGTEVTWYIPFSGEPMLFEMQPSQFNIGPLKASVNISTTGVGITYRGRAPLDPEAARSYLTDVIDKLEKYVDAQRAQIEDFNSRLREDIRQNVEQRREKVLADRALDVALEVPIVARANPSSSFAVDPPKCPRPDPVVTHESNSPLLPQPRISDAGFTDIVEVLASATAMVERLPGTFTDMKEESLRDILLVALNNQFGPASGETFSKRGKTDILIPYEGHQRAVFIAECKWWGGVATFGPAIDQLLGYLIWRDTKAALIVFSDQKDPTAVAAKAHEAMEAHDHCDRRGAKVAGHPSFIFRNPDDSTIEIQIALMIVPVIDPSDTSG